MNATQSGSEEIARYLDAVRAALADLPPAQRDDLLEDLPDHLAEVAAETGQPLADRLGSPAGYAAELRAAAGLSPGGGAAIPALATAARRLVRLTVSLDARLGPLVGYPRLRDFLVLLRPAWWVLRGYLLSLIVAHALGSSSPQLLPAPDGNDLAGIVIALAFVLGSIWLGRRTAALSLMPRRLVVAGGVLVALVGAALLHNVNSRARGDYGGGGGYPIDPYSNVSDLYPYGPDGQPLRGVTLYDQNGNPIRIGDPFRCRTQDPGYVAQQFAYPLCGVAYPYATVSPGAGATGTPSPAPTPSAASTSPPR